MAQAKRSNAGKPQLSYILDYPHAVVGVSRVLEFGANKYSRFNWKDGFKYTTVVDSLLRHLTSWQSGEDLDPESGLPHIDHLLSNALMLAEQVRSGLGTDDRWKLEKEEQEDTVAKQLQKQKAKEIEDLYRKLEEEQQGSELQERLVEDAMLYGRSHYMIGGNS